VATELRLFADYFQIHVFDEGSETDFGDLWTSQTVRDGLAVGPDAVAIGLHRVRAGCGAVRGDAGLAPAARLQIQPRYSGRPGYRLREDAGDDGEGADPGLAGGSRGCHGRQALGRGAGPGCPLAPAPPAEPRPPAVHRATAGTE
jgi:hypothetical protein